MLSTHQYYIRKNENLLQKIYEKGLEINNFFQNRQNKFSGEAFVSFSTYDTALRAYEIFNSTVLVDSSARRFENAKNYITVSFAYEPEETRFHNLGSKNNIRYVISLCYVLVVVKK